MRYGTCHFESFEAAITYYGTYEQYPYRAVRVKLAEKSIAIGPPKIKAGQKLILDPEEGRYFIETN